MLAVATTQGIGASTSGVAPGVFVDHLGYSAAFLTSGAVACVALTVLSLAMPETVSGGSPPKVRTVPAAGDESGPGRRMNGAY